MKNSNPQTASKNSKGTAQSTTSMVSIMTNDAATTAVQTKQPKARAKNKLGVHTITIDLRKSTNKLADFRRRVFASQQNIDGYPNATIRIKWGRKGYLDGRLLQLPCYSIGTFELVNAKGTEITLREGDKRANFAWWTYAIWDKGDATKSQFLLNSAESIIENMQFFSQKLCCDSCISYRFKYRPSLGLSKQQYVDTFIRNHPRWDSFDLQFGRDDDSARKVLKIDNTVYAIGRSKSEQKAEAKTSLF